MNRFQRRYILLVKNINFSSQMLYRSVSNEQISSDFLQQISKESLLPFGVLTWNIVYFYKITRFQ